MLRSAFLFASLLCACTGRGAQAPPGSSEAGAQTPEVATLVSEVATSGSGAAASAASASAAKLARVVERDLIVEAGRAELDAGGILIDVGSLDMHKYSRGGWMSGWARNELDEGNTIARIDARIAWLDVVVTRPVLEIVVRAKGRGKLGIALGKGPARSFALSASYATHRIALPKALQAGRHRLKLVGRNAKIDWVWLSDQTGAELPPTDRWQAEGRELSTHNSSLSFTLLPAEGASLEVHTRGEGKISIHAERDGHKVLVLISDAPAGTHTIALPKEFSGQPTRLRIASSGTKIAWEKLALVRDAPEVASKHSGPKNIILLLIDTQRADSFSVVSGGKGVGAAAYESLVKTSTTFKNAYNNENWTKPSIASIDTGLYPTSHLARWRKDKCSTDLEFVSEHLQDAGFSTAALVSNISAGPKFGFKQGWDLFEKTDNAKHAFFRALRWLDGRDQSAPFFLYVQTIDPHVPFSVPEGSAEALFGGPYRGKLGPSFEQSEEDALNAGTLKLGAEDARWLQALYDAEVLYHDKHLGLFLEGLRERKILKDTALVILNDHGEEFGEQGRWGHGWTTGDVLYRSPLLMHFPGYYPAEQVDTVVEHIDVAPTLVQSLGVAPMQEAEGESLMPLLHKEEATGLRSALLFARPKKRAVRVGDYKMVLQGNRSQKLFSLAKDTRENVDLAASHPIALRLCELALGEAIANPNKSKRLADRSDLLEVRPEYIPE